MQTVNLPSTVRIKPGALGRLGVYLNRAKLHRVAVFHSEGLPEALLQTAAEALASESIQTVTQQAIDDNSVEQAMQLLESLPRECQALVGLGGGKALDVAKYCAFLADLPYYAVPTSLSNDGFCSPQSSLTLRGNRRSLRARLPRGVIVDTTVCLQAPIELWLSGVGDLVAKLTAIHDWKLAFHARGVEVNDLAALLSDATVFQFVARPTRDEAGITPLATALMLNGISMEIAGSSRPASGSEHLISHALDQLSSRPRLHGLQVGVASYLVSLLQRQATATIAELFARTEFWQAIEADPFRRDEWLRAVEMAPRLRPGFYTILDARDCQAEVRELLSTDEHLQRCFVDD